MNAGIELDVLIAEKIMGCKVSYPDLTDPSLSVFAKVYNCGCNDSAHSFYGEYSLKAYSTDIAAAWEVLYKMKTSIQDDLCLSFNEGEWLVYLEGNFGTKWLSYSETAPHAICLAALKAIGELK